MKPFSRVTIAVTGVALLWVGFAYTVTRPADAKGYRRTALQVAESTHDAAATGALTGRLQLDRRVFTAFSVTAYDDARKGLAAAAKKLAGQAPPDDESAALRDQLAPLVQATVRDLGDASQAEDEVTLRTSVRHLDDVAGKLDDLIEQYQ